MRTYYATGDSTGFSLGLFGTLVFGPFYLMGWLLTLPFRLGGRQGMPVLLVDSRYQRDLDEEYVKYLAQRFEEHGLHPE